MNPNSGDSREGLPRLDASLDATDAADSTTPLVPPFRSTGAGENGGRNMSWSISDLLGPAVSRPSSPAPEPESKEMELEELSLVDSVESEPTGAVSTEDQSWLITEESEELPFLRLEDEAPEPSPLVEAADETEVVPDWMTWTQGADETTEPVHETLEQPSARWTEEALTHGELPMLDLTEPVETEAEADMFSSAVEAEAPFAPELEEEEELSLEEPSADLAESHASTSAFSPADSEPTADESVSSDALALDDMPWYGELEVADEAEVQPPEPVEEEAIVGTYWDRDEDDPFAQDLAPAAEEERLEPQLLHDETSRESIPSAFVETEHTDPVEESVTEYAVSGMQESEATEFASDSVETTQSESFAGDLPTAELESTEAAADAAVVEVASRLEEIASRLRAGGAAGLAGAGRNDPLELLVTGFVLGYSQRSVDAGR